MKKAELRKRYLERQRGLTPRERATLSGQIAMRFVEHVDLGRVKTLHCFIPLEKFNEIDTMLVFERLWREYPGIHTVVPRVDLETGEMRSLKFVRETELVKNAWDIHEPLHHKTVEPGEIDMVLVPLLCFDTAGHRVGYGKGFYDRFLARCRPDCMKIGLSYLPPVDEIDDIYEGDITLDKCVTPASIFGFSGI